MKTIGIIVAMDKEIAQLSALLEDKKDVCIDGFNYVTGRLGDRNLVLKKSGIGKVNAAIAATSLIHEFHPDYLISTGVAGGLGPEVGIMEVVASRDVVYHDYFIEGEGEGGEIALPFPCDPYLIQQAEKLAATSDTKINIGRICTGDQFITEKDKLIEIKKKFPNGLAVDMESCAIAHTCQVFSVPFISFRIISDTVGAELHLEEYKNFWAEMAEHSFDVVQHYLLSL